MLHGSGVPPKVRAVTLAQPPTLLPVDARLGAAVLLLAVGAALVAYLGGLGHERGILTAVVRAAVQLGIVSLLIAAIVGSLPLTVAFLLLMFGVATYTAGRRMTRHRSGWWAAVPVGLGTAPVILGLLVGGLVPAKGIVLVPIAGILIGGAMTATALAGRRALDELTQRRGEVEAALALGLPDRDAALEVCRPGAAQALLPPLDQTRTVGLVTLPGAFVGMLLGGATPLAAGAVQLFVLVALLAVEAVAVVATIELAARGLVRRG
ncbi:MAG: UDP-glucose/iron transport system permease protein [Actinomycetota bacterium]|nr:transporter permease [Cryptosporangiaceae bacterium]MDQ1676741.1 UDP-glucose/iron transport system permease protein [Actinomycetota bacterium]